MAPTVSPAPTSRLKSVLLIALVCLPGIAASLWFTSFNTTGWGIDFNQFYSASHLVGTGHAYDWDALRKLEDENGNEIPSARLPVVLYGFKILQPIPYRIAHWIWLGLSIAALVVFALAWPGTRAMLLLFAIAWSLPVTLILLFGQDIPFWLMFFSLGMLLLDRGRPASAGLAFAFCISKFHLAVCLPILLIAHKKWGTIRAGAVAVAAFLALSFAIEGPNWPREYLKLSRMPQLSPAPERMPNLFGIGHWLPWPAAFEIGGALAIAALLWLVCRRESNLGLLGAATAACGVLLGHHGYAGDTALLIPLGVMTAERPSSPGWLRIGAILMLTPLPTGLLFSDRPYLGQILIAVFVVTAVAMIAARRPVIALSSAA